MQFTDESQGLLNLQPGWHQDLASLVSTGSSQVVEHALSMCEVLGSMFQNKERKKIKEHRRENLYLCGLKWPHTLVPMCLLAVRVSPSSTSSGHPSQRQKLAGVQEESCVWQQEEGKWVLSDGEGP